ncbi:unnamed protein product [Phyllotreta striolata]|uniref:Uncharacterized protein n=1 Tax=Phyllotreta striolata TaxID=444603 RepID=A0A9N9TS98_PHYSR|nr:unnamed protein product [Phyllotreta striolata]
MNNIIIKSFQNSLKLLKRSRRLSVVKFSDDKSKSKKPVVEISVEDLKLLKEKVDKLRRKALKKGLKKDEGKEDPLSKNKDTDKRL